MRLKQTYVGLVRALRAVLRACGLLRVLDAWARRSRTGRWVRSLLAIYDVHDLVALDTPWWTFDAVDRVAEHLAARPGATVFEWGSGASTAWLSRRAGSVVSIEHDAGWAVQVRDLVGPAADVRTVEPVEATDGGGTPSAKPGFEDLDFTAYVHAVDDQPHDLDLIVIDGRAREACLARACAHLAEDGLLVLDNVDRRRYRDAIAAEPGMEVLWTRGLTPSLPYPTRTALLRRARRA